MSRAAARAGGAATALALLLGTAAPALAAAPAPLEQARRAAEQTAFEGVMEVRWRDGASVRSERLRVQSVGGALTVRGANLVMTRPSYGRLLSHGDGGWEEMWLPSLGPTARPDGVAKYRTTQPVDGPPVAGRATRVVEVHHDGALLERIYLDTVTGLLLQRDQFDGRGEVARTLAFASIDLNPTSEPPAEPRSAARHAPKAVQPHRLPTPSIAPPVLAQGYERLGIYRSGGVLHVLYGDGLYDLSLFHQPGRLRRSELPPGGERVSVGRATGWRYPWPGGQLVVWSGAGQVHTAVSDAPAEQVLAALRSLPRVPTRELSLLEKVHRATQALMEPLS